jgi:hypothetical protein
VAFGHQSQHVLLAVGDAERIPAATAYVQLRYEFRIERGAAPSDGGIQDAICAEGERFSKRLSEENRLTPTSIGSPGLAHARSRQLVAWMAWSTMSTTALGRVMSPR